MILFSLARLGEYRRTGTDRTQQRIREYAVAGGAPPDAAFNLVRGLFGRVDVLRRAQGNMVGAFGLNPTECVYRIIALGPYWRLRDYGNDATSRSVLIVAAPIKRPYIWDLTPSTSAIRYCLEAHLHVHLLEWLPASPGTGNNGLDEYARAISDCIAQLSADGRGVKPFLIGHSLGGTHAAIYCAFAPASVRGLVLLGAPLCFEPKQSTFRDAIISLVPSALSEAESFPGSLLSQMSALASPSTFIWSRLMDAAMSLADHRAMELHARIERWMLDEIALSGRLVHQLVEWLFRENRLCRGALKIGESRVDASGRSVPNLAIVNTDDDIAPLTSVKPSLMLCRQTKRASSNIPAKSAYACNILASSWDGKHGRRFGHTSSPG